MTTQLQHAQRLKVQLDSWLVDNTVGNHKVHIFCDDFGYKLLGSGAFSTVIQHPENPDLVIKLTVGSGPGLFKEDGYIDYVIACMKAPKSKYLPEFHAAVVGKRCAVVVMRKYRKADRHVKGLTRFVPHELAEFKYPTHGQEQLPTNGDAGIKYVVSQLGYATDLHSANYMYDPDNDCIVATDPYASRDASKIDVDRYIGKHGAIVVEVEHAQRLPYTGTVTGRIAHRIPPMQELPRRIPGAAHNAFMSMIRKPLPRIDRMPLRSMMRLGVGDQAVFHVHKKRDAEMRVHYDVENREYMVAPYGGGAPVRVKAEDPMLRELPKHDPVAFAEGLQRILFPRPEPWRVRTPWEGVNARATGPKGQLVAADIAAVERAAIRQYAEHAAACGIVAAQGVNHAAIAGEVWDQVQPANEQDCAADP